MSVMTNQQAQTLISDLIDEVIEVTNPEGEFAFEEYMKVGDMSRAEEVNFRIAGFGMPQEREVLEDVDFDVPLYGEKQTITSIKYGRAFRVARETIKDLADAGPHDGVNAAKLLQFGEYTKRLKRKGWERADLECALKLINGTSTAAKYVGRDGKSLFSTSQTNLDNPPLTQSNLTTGAALTAANVMTAITAVETQRDDRGEFVSTSDKYKLIVPPSLRWKAIEILKTSGQVDTANNTINPLKGLNISSVVVKTLDRANGASYTGWFLQNENHELRFRWREKPTFQKDSNLTANSLEYAMFMQLAHYHADWRGIIGFPPS
jgi:hypothetical protein